MTHPSQTMPPHPPRESFTLAQTSPLGDPFPGPTAIISWWRIALGFPKPQCQRVSLSLTLSPHHNFLPPPPPPPPPKPSSGTLTLWRHNCMVSWCKMRRQGEAWQHLWTLEFQVSLRYMYCSSQPADMYPRSFCRTPSHYLNAGWPWLWIGYHNGLAPDGKFHKKYSKISIIKLCLRVWELPSSL